MKIDLYSLLVGCRLADVQRLAAATSTCSAPPPPPRQSDRPTWRPTGRAK